MQKLAQPERQSIDGLADSLINRLLEDAKEKSEAQTRKELQPLIDAAVKRAETAEEQLKIAQASHQSATKNHSMMSQAVSQLQGQVKALQAEIALWVEEESKDESKEEGNEMAEIKSAISGLGQLIKSQKPTIVQSSPIRIPDFDIAPVRDGVGNLIGATVKPIGGN